MRTVSGAVRRVVIAAPGPRRTSLPLVARAAGATDGGAFRRPAAAAENGSERRTGSRADRNLRGILFLGRLGFLRVPARPDVIGIAAGMQRVETHCDAG